MARDFLKKDKICLVCGEGFKATGKAITCSGACRATLLRFSKSGTKPQYCFLVKSKGQELPGWVVELMKEPEQKTDKKEKTKKVTEIDHEVPVTEESKSMSKAEQLKRFRTK